MCGTIVYRSLEKLGVVWMQLARRLKWQLTIKGMTCTRGLDECGRLAVLLALLRFMHLMLRVSSPTEGSLCLDGGRALTSSLG